MYKWGLLEMKGSWLNQVPGDTALAARSVFHPENRFMSLGDHLGEILDGLFLDPIRDPLGMPNQLGIFLALVSVFQFHEELTDMQTCEAIRLRLEWKYALHLSLLDPGLHPYQLCDFRLYLHYDAPSRSAFQLILDHLNQANFYNRALTADASEVISTLCWLNRVNQVAETLREALKRLVVKDPDWIRQVISPSWYSRYLSPAYHAHLKGRKEDLEQSALIFGKDIEYLLNSLSQSGSLELTTLPEIIALKRVQEKNFYPVSLLPEGCLGVCWRVDKCVYTNHSQDGDIEPSERCTTY